MQKLDKRKAVIVTVNILWILFILSLILPIGQRGFPKGGVSTTKVVGKLVRYPANQFMAFLYGNQPQRGPSGTAWDWMKRTDDPLRKMKWNLKATIQFGSKEAQSRYYGPVNPDKITVDPHKITRQIKEMAKMLGALDARVCELDQDLVYPTDKGGIPVSYPHKNAISLIFEEELGHPFPPGDDEYAPSYFGKVSHGYFLMDTVGAQVAEYIRNLGYPAVVHSNGNVHSIAFAVKAGHGELGRHGQLITRNWGPNVRIATVTTDIPLIIDPPVDIGVQDFCEQCTLCYEYCPSKAIAIEKSVIRNVEKFGVNYQRCRRTTIAGMEGDCFPNTCSICRDVCPWAKEGKYWLHRFGRYIVSRSIVARRMMLYIDYILYSRENRYNMKRIVDELQTRVKKSYEIMPDDSEHWMTVGSRGDEEGEKARQYYVLKYPFWWDFHNKYRPVIFPYKGTDNPNFGKFPEWTDPWGRVVKSGQWGANGLDPLEDIFQWAGGSTLTAGCGPGISPDMLNKPPKGSYGVGYGRNTDPFSDYPT
jgi:ferredoxin